MNAMKKQDDGLFLTELLHSSRKPEEAEKRKKPHQEPLKTERTQRSDRPNDVKLRQVAAPQEKHVSGHIKLLQSVWFSCVLFRCSDINR